MDVIFVCLFDSDTLLDYNNIVIIIFINILIYIINDYI